MMPSPKTSYLLSRLHWLHVLLLLGLLAPIFSRLNIPMLAWPLDLLSHWQWQYGIMCWLVIFAKIGMIKWQKKHHSSPTNTTLNRLLLISSIFLLIVNFLLLPPTQTSHHTQSANSPHIRVASFNVNLDNHQTGDVRLWVLNNNIDIISLLETTPEWTHELTTLRAQYPYQYWHLENSPFGMAILSKRPLHHAQFIVAPNGIPHFEAWLQPISGTQPYAHLVIIHPMPPISQNDFIQRNRLFSRLAQENTHYPTIVMGDFNASVWSASFDAWTQNGFSSTGSLRPTWTILGGLPIDHILINHPPFIRIDSGVGPRLGSDHRPIWADIAW